MIMPEHQVNGQPSGWECWGIFKITCVYPQLLVSVRWGSCCVWNWLSWWCFSAGFLLPRILSITSPCSEVHYDRILMFSLSQSRQLGLHSGVIYGATRRTCEGSAVWTWSTFMLLCLGHLWFVTWGVISHLRKGLFFFLHTLGVQLWTFLTIRIFVVLFEKLWLKHTSHKIDRLNCF